MTLFDASEIPNDRHWYPLRESCRYCGCASGYWRETNGQNVVRCGDCNSALYNAPKTETGQRVRSISTRPDIKPSRRARILEAHDHRCVGCGASDRLQIGHLLSVKQGRDLGADDALLFSDENLAPMCEECNLGFGMTSVSANLLFHVLRARAKQPKDLRPTE